MEADTRTDSTREQITSPEGGVPTDEGSALRTRFEFRADPHRPTRLIWTTPRGPARLATARAVVFGLGALMLCASGPIALASAPDLGWLDAFVLLALSMLLATSAAALAVHYARDARGRSRSVVVLHDRHIEFDLAAHRSLTEPSPATSGRVYYNDVVCLETRLELYRVLGVPLWQRKFRLVPRDAEPVLLFEDREWSTDVEGSHVRLAETIAARARVAIRDRGVVEGTSAFLGIVGARAPEWPGCSTARRR